MRFVSNFSNSTKQFFTAGQSKALLAWRLALVALIIALFVYPIAQPLATPVAAGIVAIGVLARGIFYKKNFLGSIGLGLAAAVLYFLALVLIALYVVPVVHTFTYYAWEWFMPAIGVAVLGVLLSRLVGRLQAKKTADNSSHSQPSRLRWCIRAATVLGVLFMLFTNHVPLFYSWQLRWSVRPEVLPELPDTVNNRILLRINAKEFIQNASKDNTLFVSDPHVLKLHNSDTMFWQAPLDLDTRYGRVFGTTSQVIHVDADKVKMHADTVDGEKAFFLFGANSWVVRSMLAVRHPFSKPGEASTYRKENGEWVTLYPYTSSLPSKWGSMIPRLSGVAEVSKFGMITDHSVADAVEQFPGVFFFPTEIVRQLGQAYCNWHDGVKALATEKGYLEISENENDETSNKFPYIQEFKGIGLQAYLPLEPAGPNFAWVETLFFDTTGKPRLHIVPKHLHLNAPRKALENAYKCDPGVSWTNRRTTEPRLVKGPGGIFWMPGVTIHDPNHPDGQAYFMTALVDAETLDAYRLTNEKELEELNRFAKLGAHGQETKPEVKQ